MLLALFRFGQGLGLGGEWGGAVLLAIEKFRRGNAPGTECFRNLARLPDSSYPGALLVLSRWLTDEQFFAFGWRIPFLLSSRWC